MNKLIN